MEIVRGHLQSYDWGGTDGLSAWTAPTGRPQAELWFGSHPNGPSPLRDAPGAASAPMPLLTKLLSAARPLSIQIHPPAAMAEAQYDVQQADPGAPRLLSDPYAKAEILIALEPFEILGGFRDARQSAAVLSALGPGLGRAAAAATSGDIKQCVRTLLTLGIDDVFVNAARLPEAFLTAGLSAHDAAVIDEVVRCFPGDPGVFVAALLSARTLAAGEAVYVTPGTAHAYVRGTGIEVMTNSDNVLRLGLTTKTVAVDAALAAMSVAARPHLVARQSVQGVDTYAPQGAPFIVKVLTGTRAVAATGAGRTLLCLDGTVTVAGLSLAAGEALLLGPDDPDAEVKADGRAVLASDVA
ncbi:MAG: mannose-6-phosphate isomerase, class I [Micrococcales bacterium]|nr:mannose-6-phosphate isomerase, class I [Micrococcales bacterium]